MLSIHGEMYELLSRKELGCLLWSRALVLGAVNSLPLCHVPIQMVPVKVLLIAEGET